MQNPKSNVRQIRTTGENELYIDLISPFLNGDKDEISSYRLKHIVPGGGETAYAVYEVNHNIMAVQFYYGERLLTFGDDEPIQFMSIEEIKLTRELGEVTIDGMTFSIDSVSFNIIDGAIGCQHMIIFNLITNY